MIHLAVSFEKLAVMRIVLFIALALYALMVPGERLTLLSADLQVPVGFARYLPWTSSRSVILGLRLCAATLLIAAALGTRHFRWIALAGMSLFTTYVAILHPGHRELGAIYLGFALAVAPAANAWSLNRATETNWGIPAPLLLQVTTFVFLLSYSMIGVERALYSAPTVFLDDSIIWHIAANSDRNGAFGFSIGYRLLEVYPTVRSALPLGFFLATWMEALAPLALFWNGFRRLFLAFATTFHLTNLLLLNIEFTLNILVVLLLLLDWSPLAHVPPARNIRASLAGK